MSASNQFGTSALKVLPNRQQHTQIMLKIVNSDERKDVNAIGLGSSNTGNAFGNGLADSNALNGNALSNAAG